MHNTRRGVPDEYNFPAAKSRKKVHELKNAKLEKHHWNLETAHTGRAAVLNEQTEKCLLVVLVLTFF